MLPGPPPTAGGWFLPPANPLAATAAAAASIFAAAAASSAASGSDKSAGRSTASAVALRLAVLRAATAEKHRYVVQQHQQHQLAMQLQYFTAGTSWEMMAPPVGSQKPPPQQRKRRKAEVLLSSLRAFRDDSDDAAECNNEEPKLQRHQAPLTALNNNKQQQQQQQSALLQHHQAAAVRVIRNDLHQHQQHHHHHLARLQFASGSPVVLAAASAPASPASVRLDIGGSGGGIRAEVAFSGALEPATSATGSAQQQQQQQRWFQQHQQHHQHHHFVQVHNPLCVPRQLDNLASWRTCMVPIVDLEQFAFMKPPRPRWHHLGNRSSPGSAVLLFTLMCYNILSDQYASPKSYWYCPDWALSWSFRRQGILENISAYLPTIVCLQEVETEQFYSFFLPHLSRRGYDGIFSPKSRAKTMDDRMKKRVDGCAVFWKRSQFRLVSEHVIEFSQQYLERCWRTNSGCSGSIGNASSSEIFNRVTVRDNIALAVILAPAASPADSANGHVMVCTSHMHWDPQCSDVKLIQTVVLTSALAARIEQHRADTGAAELPLILCGDFNSLPRSGVIEFLNQGSVARDHPEFQRLGQDPSLDGLKLVDDSLQSTFSHSLDLQSCYNSVEVQYTNYTPDFKGIIDYIFASRGHFRVLDCLEGLSGWFKAESVVGCPHPYVPSDHIPLLVQLEMKLHPTLPAASV